MDANKSLMNWQEKCICFVILTEILFKFSPFGPFLKSLKPIVLKTFHMKCIWKQKPYTIPSAEMHEKTINMYPSILLTTDWINSNAQRYCHTN